MVKATSSNLANTEGSPVAEMIGLYLTVAPSPILVANVGIIIIKYVQEN